MPRAKDVPPRERTVEEHYMAVVTPLEAMGPILDGALHFNPSPFVCGDNAGESLTDEGARSPAL